MELSAVSGVIRTFWNTPRASLSVDVIDDERVVDSASWSLPLFSKFSNAADIGPAVPAEAAPWAAPLLGLLIALPPLVALPPSLTEEQRRAIYGGNAKQLYRLG